MWCEISYLIEPGNSSINLPLKQLHRAPIWQYEVFPQSLGCSEDQHSKLDEVIIDDQQIFISSI